ncbi:hypothetical protein M8818_006623 [Zalaria obscura]|uniref:Uncharacterized protein n=1 Tax=Zalaria obscura TaxID=2024903 RepID=A0ACC3S9F2_9PEZI
MAPGRPWFEGSKGYNPNQIICKHCEILKPQGAFSKNKLDILRGEQLARNVSYDYKIPCINCAGSQAVEMKCSTCHKVKADIAAKQEQQAKYAPEIPEEGYEHSGDEESQGGVSLGQYPRGVVDYSDSEDDGEWEEYRPSGSTTTRTSTFSRSRMSSTRASPSQNDDGWGNESVATTMSTPVGNRGGWAKIRSANPHAPFDALDEGPSEDSEEVEIDTDDDSDDDSVKSLTPHRPAAVA